MATDLDEVPALEARLKDIDAAMLDAGKRARDIDPNSFGAQELRSEVEGLGALKSVALTKLRFIKDALIKRFGKVPEPVAQTLTPDQQRRKNALALFVEERRETILYQVSIYEKSGDVRQARIWRDELIGVREQVAKEYGLQDAL